MLHLIVLTRSFEEPYHMESFEIIVKKQSYKIIRDNSQENTFNVFNHSTRHVVKRNNFGIWESVEHRFGAESLPIDEIGDAIDDYYYRKAKEAAGIF